MSDQSESWIEVLAEACKGSTQAKVGTRIGYSAGVVNAVLKGTYKGDLNRVQAAVEGALMQSTVDCPVIGDIPRQRCVENQRRPLTITDPVNIKLYKACPECPNALSGTKGRS